MRRKFIVLGNGQEWCQCALRDLEIKGLGDVHNGILPYDENKWLYKLAILHYSKKLNTFFELPFKEIWFSSFAKYLNLEDDEDLIFLIYDWNKLSNNRKFLSFLRRKYKGCKLVYIFTNIVKISGANINHFVDSLKEYYDLVNTYDMADAKKYGFNYLPNMYSRLIEIGKPQNDSVFFVGAAKDRLSFIHSAYKRIHELGFSTDFYVSGVRTDEMQYVDGIKYNIRLSYPNVVDHVNMSSCVLDIIQGDSEGYTLKVCEAIYYNKILISTNPKIKELPFYDSRYMIFIQKPEDITEESFRYVDNCQYSEEAIEYFSVCNYLKNTLKELGYE